MNRKILAPGAAGLALAAGIISAQAGLTGPLRQPVNQALDTAFDGSGINFRAGVGSHQVNAFAPRPDVDPKFDRVDAAGGVAVDTAQAAGGDVKHAARGLLATEQEAVATATSTVARAAGTSGQQDLAITSPVGEAGWSEHQLLQRTIRFDAGRVTAHTVEIKATRESARMYALQVLVDGRQVGERANIYSSGLRLDGLDVPIFVPAAQGTLDLSVSYGYFSSGSTCIASVGADDASCAATAPDPEALARLRPEVTTTLAWQMVDRPAGSSTIRTPLY